VNVARLTIHQTFAKLDWDVQRPSYQFQPAKTDVRVEHRPAEMVIERTPIQLHIDQTECWADMDRKHIFRRIREEAQVGKQALLEYVGRVAEEGEEIKRIENKGNVFRSIARRHMLEEKHQFAYRNVPDNFSLKYSITPGELKIHYNEGELKIDVQSSPFQHQYEMGRITYAVQQKNELHFEVVGNHVNTAY
jgi:hypothetical protein